MPFLNILIKKIDYFFDNKNLNDLKYQKYTTLAVKRLGVTKWLDLESDNGIQNLITFSKKNKLDGAELFTAYCKYKAIKEGGL